MRLSALRVRNFRSIHDIRMTLEPLSVVCGPNSCGKSNLLQALQFAFRDNLTRDDIHDCLPASRRAAPGPRLSIYLDLTFTDCPAHLSANANATPGQSIVYSVRAERNGTVSRSLNGKALSDLSVFQNHFRIVYVPPVRDLSSGGMRPFRMLFADALSRARGPGTINNIARQLKAELGERAGRVLADQTSFVRTLLGANRLVMRADDLSLENVYQQPTLIAEFAEGEMPLEALGTGHQSVVIINLYKQLGQDGQGHTLYLFEEPDNHLHPTTARAIGSELLNLSSVSQVLLTTHSPVLLNQFSFSAIRSLYTNSNKQTQVRTAALSSSEREIRALLAQYGVRISEPLLAKRVILVEGPADANVLSVLLTRRMGRTPDDADMFILPAGGKAGVVRIGAFLKQLGCEWWAVLDWDAAFAANPPFADMAKASLFGGAMTAIQSIKDILDSTSRRGRGVRKGLEALESELTAGYAPPPPLIGSPLEQLLTATGGLTGTARRELGSAIGQRAQRRYRDQLKERSVILWSGTLEEILLRDAVAENVAEDTLVSLGRLGSPVTGTADARRRQLLNLLHDLGTEPSVIRSVVEELDAAHIFQRTEVNAALRLLMAGI